VQAFHRVASAGLLAHGILRLYALRLNGQIVASYHGFRRGERAYYYLGGFDPEWKRFGVGNLIIDHAMGEAATEGAKVFNFLRGRESYKYRWGAKDDPTYRLSWAA
jgi:CelD/BcsL family acetyltransferase involved in cellulose biosynthesis